MPPEVMLFNEAKTVENPILKWLVAPMLDWQYENQTAVARKYRADEKEVLLLPILRAKLKELNPEVITTDERAEMVVSRLRALRDNAEWISWLRNEQTFQFGPDEKAQPVTLVDYDDLDANDFLATNQFWVEGVGGKRRRTDVLLFVNGIPLVNAEAKTTTRDEHIEWREGAKQTGDYSQDVPQLYYSNAFCCGVNELRMFYGVPGVPFHKWQQWRDPWPHQIPAFEEMRCGVHGLLDRRNLLEIIRNFIVFETEQGKVVKKIARYQQFRAANELVGRALDVEKPRGWRRGIVWHTQGSGKSLTMLFAARKLWTHPDLKQPTIIVVVDREQLQDQMAGQMFATNTENCRVAENKADLMRLLREDYRGIIVTIMHKFERYDDFTTPRRDIIMMVDEAHRTQYGQLAMAMRAVLPEASLFGFTGTPLELTDRNTPVNFGRELGPDRYERYMDKYSIADAIKDGATIPIHFEPRMTDWKVWGEKLDAEFLTLFGDLSEGEREALKKQEAKLKVIITHPDRIAQIAQDVAEHFKTHIQPNGFKAMLVCWDKDTCALYKAALDPLLGKETSVCIFSEAPKDDEPNVKQHYLGDKDRKEAIKQFTFPKPEKPEEVTREEYKWRQHELVIVCDMLLTGFDAPIVQAMYLDKGLKNHTLLQAIARVNRPYNELKRFGLILDYFGVFENLNEALNYDKNELGEIAFPFGRLREEFKLQIGLLSELFKDVERTGSYESLMKALNFLNRDETARERFETGYQRVLVLFETLQPDEFLVPYEREYLWLCKLWMAYRKKFFPMDRYEISADDGEKTRELIRRHVDMEELKKDFPTYVLDAEYLSKLKNENPDAKALDIEAMLAAELKIRVGEDEDFLPLSERLKHLVAQKRNGTLAGIALISELEKLTRQVVELVQESQRPVREAIAKAAMDRAKGLTQAKALEVADAIVARANDLCFENWFMQEHMDTDLYREFTVVLAQKFGGLGLHGKGHDFVERCIKLLKKVRYVSKEVAAGE